MAREGVWQPDHRECAVTHGVNGISPVLDWHRPSRLCDLASDVPVLGGNAMLGDFGSGQVFWSMLWFFLFFIWIWLLISVFSDIFRSHDLGGGAKALWT